MNIIESEVLPLDFGLTIMNMISLSANSYPEISNLYKHILLKEIPIETDKFGNVPVQIMDNCVIYFCADESLINNTHLYQLFNLIKDHVHDIYGFSNNDYQYDYNLLLNNDGIIHNDNPLLKHSALYLNAFLYVRDGKSDSLNGKIDALTNIVNHWNDITTNEQLRLIFWAFVSLDFITLYFLEESGIDLWELFLLNCDSDDLNGLFESMLVHLVMVNDWQNKTNYIHNVGIEFIMYLSKNNKAHNMLLDNLNPELRATYLSLINTILNEQ